MNETIELRDIKQVFISSNSQNTTLFNGNAKSNMRFNVSNFIESNNQTMYHTIRVLHAEFCISFYAVNIYNNTLVIDNVVYRIPIGNYSDIAVFIEQMTNILPTGMLFSINTLTGKLTLSYNQNFTINAASTCHKILGLEKQIAYTSTSHSLAMPYPCNLLGTRNLYIRTPSLVLENINMMTLDNSTILSIPITEPMFGFLSYSSNDGDDVLRTKDCDYVDIQIIDDDGNFVDFNNSDWSITFEIKRIYQIQKFKYKTIRSHLEKFQMSEEINLDADIV